MKSGVIEPDALTGMILGAEGIPDVAVLLNGPTGCKFYHGHVAHVQRGGSEVPDPYLTLEPWFFGQPRVPCTYLDDEDYIFGAGQKLHEILPSLAARWDGLILVVNAPGAALIGDDLEKAIALAGIADRCIPVETPGFSCPGPAGTDRGLARVLRPIAPAKEKARGGTVNLPGLSL
ncbi:MAG: nitrogenase component 1, partial [Methanoculleus sp.]|nr:nitrogenase component 1 [Methanoculleus sp.]